MKLPAICPNQTPNFATTNPKLISAKLVLIQARNVRSAARSSAAFWCSDMGFVIALTRYHHVICWDGTK